MRKKIDHDMPIGALKRVEDFLPKPDQLAAPREDVKVTLALSRRSVLFFKAHARRNHTKYQRMIRELIDRYAAHFEAER